MATITEYDVLMDALGEVADCADRCSSHFTNVVKFIGTGELKEAAVLCNIAIDDIDSTLKELTSVDISGFSKLTADRVELSVQSLQSLRQQALSLRTNLNNSTYGNLDAFFRISPLIIVAACLLYILLSYSK